MQDIEEVRVSEQLTKIRNFLYNIFGDITEKEAERLAIDVYLNKQKMDAYKLLED